MREHIYKAKRVDNGEWVEGLPIRSHIGFSSRIDTIQYAFGGYLPTYKIDPETLCEYTGLKDKNGNKIFENDILKFDDESFIGVCVYKEKIAQFMLGDYDKDKDWFDFQPQMAEQSIIIIGNIFDNKELLGE